MRATTYTRFHILGDFHTGMCFPQVEMNKHSVCSKGLSQVVNPVCVTLAFPGIANEASDPLECHSVGFEREIEAEAQQSQFVRLYLNLIRVAYLLKTPWSRESEDLSPATRLGIRRLNIALYHGHEQRAKGMRQEQRAK